ncbi:hypothetical protein ACFP7A_07360 [Sporolactobacillus kofuensis]|uniref:Uncharacterized protein n=1 Tax=Sporolactobacillus kofuensis TaxID=269672 RepID=A0ABW1WFQ8_9BACL|nr:hypothetical protein [Sporolactobacillus kofuensis]MCO7177108.1 hypothetical protein [Sporolactobacillus kofuensis]
MNPFTFYYESEGKRTNPDAYNKPLTTIHATDIQSAALKFAEQSSLKLVDYETLLYGNYRVYLETTRPFWNKKEQIYYVTMEE